MRFSTIAVAAAAGALAQNATESICDRYTVALLMDNTAANQYTLLTLLVKTVVLGNFTGPGTGLPDLPGSMVTVPGLLADGEVDGEAVSLAQYFNGSLLSTNRDGEAVSVNFLDSTEGATEDATALGADGSNQARLLTHLIQFFGAALGCSQYNSDGFPAYAGTTGQASVHQFMAIGNAENTYFIQQVGLAASSFGASEEDVTAVGTLLTNVFNYRCAAPAAVLPDAEPEYQVVCQDDSCPLASTTESVCSGEAAFSDYTATEPVAAMTTGGSESETATITMTDSTGSPTATTESEGTDTATEDMATTGTGDNYAARQTAAAGIAAAAGIVAAAFL